ncbi:hypothetical protein ACHAXT_012299 [Thalassiosira profunda]
MKLAAAIVLGLLGAADGFCPPKRVLQRKIARRKLIRRKKLIKKSLLVAPLVGPLVGAAAAGTVVAGAGAVGAAVAINQLNTDREVYQPAAGSMDGQVVVVTGGSSGLGLETAKRLAAAGAKVVLTSRTGAKGAKAVDAVKEYLIGKGMDAEDAVFSLQLDLDDLSNVKQFAAAFAELQLGGDISCLINNAGVMAIPDRQLTADGYERTFQSNHLGHFVLTSELFPYLSRKGAKVINVSSSAANIASPGLDLENLNGEKSYTAWGSYGISKLANILFTNELQKRADNAGLDWLTTVALHPGVVNTDLWRYIVGEERLAELKEEEGFSLGSLALTATSLFTKTPEMGANTQVFLAAEDDIVKGAFYEERKEKTRMPPYAKDEEKAKALWEVSEELGGVVFEVTDLVDVAPAVEEQEELSKDADSASSEEDVEVEDSTDVDEDAEEDEV